MAEKTEKPTAKKRRDSAKKGQTFRSRDLTTTVVILAGIFYLGGAVDFRAFISLYSMALLYNPDMSVGHYLIELTLIFLRLALPFIVLCSVVGIGMTLMQTKFMIATEAFRINGKALNPVEGLKRIFSLRTLKELVKSIIYLGVLAGTCYTLVVRELTSVLAIYHVSVDQLIPFWTRLAVKTIVIFIIWSLLVLLAEFIVEYFLYIKAMKMDKHEVKQERKELQGNPEIKRARRRAHIEILNSEERSAIRNSEMLMVNPTHIAIAIYFNVEVAMLPFIALRCANMKAKAAIAYAEEIGIPIVRDIMLTRRLYKNYSNYSFISLNDQALMEVMELLIWLRQVERAEFSMTQGDDEANGMNNNHEKSENTIDTTP